MPRHALHARLLGFEHPTTHEQVSFESELPADFKALFGQSGRVIRPQPKLPTVSSIVVRRLRKTPLGGPPRVEASARTA